MRDGGPHRHEVLQLLFWSFASGLCALPLLAANSQLTFVKATVSISAWVLGLAGVGLLWHIGGRPEPWEMQRELRMLLAAMVVVVIAGSLPVAVWSGA